MWTMGHFERLECPPEFQQLLTDIFGVNDFGDPMYRIVWGQTETIRVSKPEGGYTDQTCGGGLPAWILQRWVSPDKWGSPKFFKLINRDPANGQLLFPYPEYGQYEMLRNLGNAPLDYELIHSTIPFLQAFARLSDAERQAAKDRQKELDERADVEMITDRLMEALPTRYGPTSYGRGGCRTSILDKKMHEIQQVWNRVDPRKLRHQKGFAQRPISPNTN
jgi:hypothetical protein